MWRGLRWLAACLCGAWLAAAALAAEPVVVGPEGSPQSLQDAVNKAQDGDTIELLSGTYRGPVTIDHRRLTLRGLGAKPPLVQGQGKLALRGALITVIGGEVTLDHLEFRGARNQDGSGAGVRQEGGRLTVRRCNFFDNEHGLVAANDAKAELTIENSVFGLAPHVVGGLYHLLDVGRIGRLSVTGSRFQQGFEGHLVRSRARESYIAYNFIHDGLRGGASYEIEFADGGLATVLGNVIAQGSERQNPVQVAYGTEGRAWDLNRLYLVNNTMINYGWLPGWFLRVFEGRVGADTQVYEINNLIVGPGIFWLGAPGHFEGNRYATLGMLRDPATYAFELPPDSIWRGSGVDPSHIDGRDLAPKAEFEWPIGTRPLKPGRTVWSPGAYQR